MKSMSEVVQLVSQMKNEFSKQFYESPTALLLSHDAYYRIAHLATNDILSSRSDTPSILPSVAGLIVEIAPSFLKGQISEIAIGGYISDRQYVILGQSGEVLKLLLMSVNPQTKWEVPVEYQERKK